MARPESVANAGYFPFPTSLLPAVASLVEFEISPISSTSWWIPAPATAAPSRRSPAPGSRLAPERPRKRPASTRVELECGRFRQLDRRLQHAHHGDAFRFSIGGTDQPGEGSSLLFLNPPYDVDRLHRRLEQRFLERWTSCLAPEAGLLVFVVPHYSLAASASFLARHYENLGAWRYPDAEFEAFRQCVLLAKRRAVPVAENEPVRRQVERWAGDASLMPELPTLARAAYTVAIDVPRLHLAPTPIDLQNLLADFRPWLSSAPSACPLRSSHHPGLFDDQESLLGDDTHPGRRASKRQPPGEPIDRCLSPSCAERKRQLFVERRVTELAAKNPAVVKLQEQDSWRPVPGLVPAHRVQDATKRTPGAVPAVVADGPNAGKVRWIKPLDTSRVRSSARTPGAGPQKLSLAARREQRLRRRKLHAIELLKPAIRDQAPPDLKLSVRLAIVFGTDRAHSHLGAWHDPMLDRFDASLTGTAVAVGADQPDAETDAPANPSESSDPTANSGAAGDESSAPPPEDPNGAETSADTAFSPGQRFWSAFEALGQREEEFARHL
jgi:hypothetical protein